MKTLLFIPGFYETLEDRDYAAVLKAFEAKGYKVRFVPLKWRRTTINHWLKEFNETFRGYNPRETILAGFSFGAVTAFLAASERNPAELWLCSLSPYFASDNPKKSGLKYIGKNRAKTFASIDFPKLAEQIHCPTVIMYGELESENLRQRAIKASKHIEHCRLIEVPETKHDIAAKKYIQAIMEQPIA